MSTTHLSRGRFGMIENEVEAENPSRWCEKLVNVGHPEGIWLGSSREVSLLYF
jgi:hypothetical protein